MALLFVHLMLTSFMTGVIWIIQVVHYPLFANVGKAAYAEYQRLHMRKITWVVLPAMVLEACTSLFLLYPSLVGMEGLDSMNGNVALLRINLFALVLIWVSTVTLQVPQHAKLTRGFEMDGYRRLVRWNWIRTIIWSLRCGLIFYLAMSA